MSMVVGVVADDVCAGLGYFLDEVWVFDFYWDGGVGSARDVTMPPRTIPK